MDAAAARLAELAERILKGDTEAESELCALSDLPIRQILRRHVHNFARVDELTQEVHIVVLIRLRREPLNEPSQLAAFIAGTARNLGRADRRKEQRQNTETVAEMQDVMLNQEPDPSVILEVNESAALVREVVQELQPRDRLAVFMYYFYGMDKASICRELRMRNSHLYLVLFRARSRMRELLQKRGMGPKDLLFIVLMLLIL
jgi:RNA polymerase sigma factor (sigma-70 family)